MKDRQPSSEDDYLLQMTRYNTMPVTEKDELARIKEEISKARESLMQEWLDSKPIIDQLEKLQVDLKQAKARASMATVVTPGLEAQLEMTYATMKSKEEKELKGRTTAEKLTRSVQQLNGETERLKWETDKEKRKRGKLKQEHRLRRQTLQVLNLTLRAIRIESEALGASTVDALHHINQSEIAADEANVELSYEEYRALVRKAHEEIKLADWRLSVSVEQRDAAEARRDKALRKLNDIYAGNISREGEIEEVSITDLNVQGINDEAGQEGSRTERRVHENVETSLGAIKVPANFRGQSQKFRGSRRHYKEKMVKKKKQSILHKIKSFLVQKITKLFR